MMAMNGRHPRRTAAIIAVTAGIALLASGIGVGRGRTPSAPAIGLTASPGATASERPRALGPTDPATPLRLTLGLRLPGGWRLRRFLADVADPAATDYRNFLSASAFGRRFGLPTARLSSLEQALRAAGFHGVAAFPQRTAVRLRATAGIAEAFFDVRLRDFRAADGTRYHAPVGPPVVPPSLRDAVVTVDGLSSRAAVHPAGLLAQIPAHGLTPSEAATAYGVTPLTRDGVAGTGQTVAVVSFATFHDADIAAFDQQFGIQGPAVERVRVKGGTTRHDLEVDLDLEVIRGLAPEAQIVDYEAPQSASIGDVVDAIVADGRADIVSLSWGLCDEPFSPSLRARDQRSIDAAVAQGISIFVASGDRGAYTCQEQSLADHRLTVDWPSSSPGVVAVGGTRLFLGTGGEYADEAGWEDVLSGTGSGGGLSPVDPRPSWQSGPGVDNADSNGKRQVPDVAGPADPDSGFFVLSTDGSGQLAGYQIGGTSAAAPFWAASTALMSQFAGRSGVKGLGFVDPMLYAIAAAPGAEGPFHDVTRGGNRRFRAAPGWDFVTGLGSPDVANLARAVMAYLRQHPAA